MQLYHGLPITTNKISLREQQGVKHHLLGCITLHEQPWRVDRFVLKALESIRDIHARNRVPILVGGTHYYVQSLLFRHSLTDEDDNSPALRSTQIESWEEWPILEASTETILQELYTLDPIIAARWHPKDRRKIRRSLEICLQTGRKASDIYEEQKNPVYREKHQIKDLRFSTLILWTYAPRDVLVPRLDNRVNQMIESGLLEEVREVNKFLDEQQSLELPIDQTRGIWVSIGYKEFACYCRSIINSEASTPDLKRMYSEAIEQTKIATRQYSRSQVKWIRNKLLNALQAVSAGDHVFVLDTSEISAWKEKTVEPASALVEIFLAGSALPQQSTVSEEGDKLMKLKQDYDLGQRPDLWINRTCATCGVTTNTEELWQQHIRGRRHRNNVKKALRQDAIEVSKEPHKCDESTSDDTHKATDSQKSNSHN